MKQVVLAFSLALAASAAFAQNELTIDLKDTGTIALPVAPGDYTIRIINVIPGKQYNVTSVISPVIEAPISIAAAKVAVTPPATPAPAALPGGPLAAAPLPPTCAQLQTDLDTGVANEDGATLAARISTDTTRASGLTPACTLNIAQACARLLALATTRFTNASTPAEQKAAIIDIRAWGHTAGCANVVTYADQRCAALLTTAQGAVAGVANETAWAAITAPLRVLRDACTGIDTYLNSIEQVLGPVSVGRNEMLTVTIVRQDNNTTWVRTYTTGRRGDWLAGYGILLAPNRDASYTSAALGGNTYQIRRNRDREAFDFVPTLTFTFMRGKDAGKDWFHAPVFGIGYDLQTISATFGYSYTYNHNFAISAGLMLHQQQRLKGKYEENEYYEKTGAILENSDLTEKTWAPNVYFGITIRSLTNPFAR
ncbi:MAG: hypothetical protein DMF56_09660 [Acidobacteria bacterium]|nr:MAG: hypothetical protein DMF56_09660 [Acidobacteriota bacterium]